MRKIFYIFLTIFAAIIVFVMIAFLFSLNKQKGGLQVNSIPKSAVYLDGKLVGNTQLCLCEGANKVSEGKHILKLVPMSGDYTSFEHEIMIYPETKTVVDKHFLGKGLDNSSIISLSPLNDKKSAEISILTLPSGAQIFINNLFRGTSPILLKNVKESEYDLRIVKEGYRTNIFRINVKSGYRLEALVTLGLNEDLIATPAAIKDMLLVASISANRQLANIEILDTPTGYLRVRKDSSLTSVEIAQVKPGEIYRLVSEVVGWYEIRLLNDKTGWISSRYAKKTP
jgi:hypothetical protein